MQFRAKKQFLVLACLLFFSMALNTTSSAEEIEALLPKIERIAVLDFQALDDQGNLADPVRLRQLDLINLSRVMALGVASRLVQYGEYEIIDGAALTQQLGSLPYTGDTPPFERARILLQEHGIDQVITGSLTLLQTSAVVGVQRFQLIDGEPKLVGSSMASSLRVSEAPATVDSLMAALFPADVQVIERAIEQVFLVPSQLRLNLGASHKINAFAVDNLGRPVANPSFLFFSNDESKINIGEDGTVTGLQPGTATVTVRGVSRTARSGPPATMNVTVVPPALGFRVGTLVTDREGIDGRPIRLGMRLTPTFDQKGTTALPPTTVPTNEPTNPLSFISSFFSSLLTNGLVTIDLDFDPTREMLFALNGVQRSSTGYIGTGVGYVTPLGEASHQAFAFRFTMGTQAGLNSRISLPAEVVLDMIFPTSSVAKPSFRIGINLGLDLFP